MNKSIISTNKNATIHFIKKLKKECYNTLSKLKRNVSYPPSTAHTTFIFYTVMYTPTISLI